MEQSYQHRTISKDYGSTLTLFNMKFEQHSTRQQSLLESQRKEELQIQPTVVKYSHQSKSNRQLDKQSLLNYQWNSQRIPFSQQNSKRYQLIQIILKQQNMNLKQQNQMLLQQVSKLKDKKHDLKTQCIIKRLQLQEIKRLFNFSKKREDDLTGTIMQRLQILERKVYKRTHNKKNSQKE